MVDHTPETGRRPRHGRVAAIAGIAAAALMGSVLYAIPANAATPGVTAGTPPAGALADAPAAAQFQPVPAAHVKNGYDESLFTPPVGGEGTTYTVYGSMVDTSVTPNVTYYDEITSTSVAGTVGIDGGLVLDLATGRITASAVDLRMTDNVPRSYIVVVNNGVGGADTPSDGTPYGDSGGYTEIPVALHDVSSGAFSVPVLFTDVATDNPFTEAIYGLSGYGIMAGYADGSFQPTLGLSRQAFARAVVQMLSQGEYGTGPHPCTYSGLGYLGLNGPFNDVPWTSPFCMDIMVLSVYGITEGFPDGGFHPKALITRQAIAAMAFRLYGVGVFGDIAGDAACTAPIPFNDVDAGNQFCGDIEWLHANGLSNGYRDGSYRPTVTTSRQAGAGFLYRFLMKYGSDLSISGPFPTAQGQGLAGADVARALASAQAAGASE
jgi:hypothetical protein